MISKILGDVAAAAQEQAVGKLHDISFVNGMNFLALILAGVLEGEFGDTGRRFFGDDLQALDHPGNDLVFESGVEALSIFADDDEIDIGITRRNVRQIADGTEVGVELELLAQRDVDAGKAATDGRGHRPLQGDAGALNRFDDLFGDVLPVLLESVGAYGEGFPFELDAGGFEDADGCVGNFRPDAVAGDEGDFVRHVVRHDRLVGLS